MSGFWRFFVPAVAVALGVAGTSLTTPPAGAKIPPNFVLIVTDDQRWDSIGRCLGGFDPTDMAAGDDACMPHLQRDLAARGTTFLRGYVPTALCCPSRASILTGLETRNHKVASVPGFVHFDDSETLATWLGDGGAYRTGLFGKYLNGYGQPDTTPPGYVPPGWDTWQGFWGAPAYDRYRLLEKSPGEDATVRVYRSVDSTSTAACADGNLYSTDLLCHRALDFLAADSSAPFLLYWAPFSPHGPAVAPARWKNANASVQFPVYPSFGELPSPNPPSYLPSEPLAQSEHDKATQKFHAQLNANRAVDDALHAFHELLTADGRLENTVFVFISDNGLSLREHRLGGKDCPKEQCHRVPMVIACPETLCPGTAPGTVDGEHLALNIDVAPTVLELAGISPSLAPDGASLVPLLVDPAAAPWRSSFYIHSGPRIPARGVVATEPDGHTYKYVETLGGLQRELYDLTEDPWELVNLVDDGEHGDVQASVARQVYAVYGVRLWVTVEGAGAVRSSPAGISCPGRCHAPFELDAEVTLTVAAADGWVFAGWGGDCTGTETCRLLMGAHRSVTATFAPA